MSSDTVAVYTSVAGLAINGIGLAFVAIQVVLARQQIRGTFEQSAREALRVKRQATIDFYMATMQKVGEWREQLPDDWDTAGICSYVDGAYRRKGGARRRILAIYIGYFEALAVAVHSGIYDLSVIDSLAGAYS